MTDDSTSVVAQIANELCRNDGAWRPPNMGVDIRRRSTDLTAPPGPRSGSHGQPRFYWLPDAATAVPSAVEFDPHTARRDFPALHQQVHGRPLVWLDNAATAHKPQRVIDAVSRFYERDNSNVHRGAHTLAARATDAYEGARSAVARWLRAGSSDEIIFVRGTTEAINLVAQSFGRKAVRAGDEIVLTQIEHHANIVPWQMLAEERGAVLRVAPVTDAGEIDLESYARLLGPRTRIVALGHASNVLGTVLPIRLMTAMAHEHGAVVLVDGAQAVPHHRVDVRALDCDFYVFSGHKLFGPTGVGALYGKASLLGAMPPWQGGGSMIAEVTFERTTFNTIPHKFEAGTGTLAGAVGLGAAIDYLEKLGFERAGPHEDALLAHATEALSAVPGVQLLGSAGRRVAVVSFTVAGTAAEDVAAALDRDGIAVRAGHHCAQPTMRRFAVPATVRASFAFYNTHEEVDALVGALRRVARVAGA